MFLYLIIKIIEYEKTLLSTLVGLFFFACTNDEFKILNNVKSVANAMIELLLPYKSKTYSITMDNNHSYVAKQLDVKTYFTHPYASWEKGQIVKTILP